MHRNSKSHSQLVGNIVILSVLVLSLFWTTTPISAQTKPTGVPNLDVVLVIDESGSMWSVSDPPNASNQGWRIVMAKLFADLLGVDQSGATHALSVIFVGTQAKTVRDLTLIQDSASRESFKTAIDVAHAATENKVYYTNIPDALTQAYNELDTHGHPKSEKVVIFLSDGKCELADATAQADCNKNIRQIVKDHFVDKYPLFTIAFTNAAYSGGDSTIYENLWQEIADETNGEYYQPNKAEGDLLNVYIQILRHLFNLSPQDTPKPITSPTTQKFTIPEGQLQAVFTIVKNNKSIKTTIIRPNGAIVKDTDPDVKSSSSPQTDSYSFIRPEAGQWSVQLEGSGEVTVVYIPFPTSFLQVIHKSPSGLTHPMGKPMNITIEVDDASGNPQSSLEGLKVDVTLPDGTVQTLPFTGVNDTIYSARLDDTSQIGLYKLHFYGGTGDKIIDDTQTVDIIKVPWIRVLEPKPDVVYSTQKPLAIQAQMMDGTNPVTVPDPSDTITVTAQLFDANSNSIDLQQLQLDDGIFSREMKIDTLGSNELTVRMVLVKLSGEQYQDVTIVYVRAEESSVTTITPSLAAPIATPRPAPQPTQPPIGPLLGGLGGLIVLAGLGGLGWWWYNRPSLIGSLDSGGMQASFPLSGRKPVYIGSDVHCQFNIQGSDILPKHAELRPIGNRKNPQVEIRSLDPSKPVRVDKLETIFQTLHDGNIIKIGGFEYTYSGPPSLDDFEADNSITSTPTNNKNDEDSWKF